MKLISHLEDNCVAAIASLAEVSQRTDYSRITYNDGLKYSILYDPLVEITVESSTSFSISERIDGDLTLYGPSICEGRLVDFVLGAKRVKAQYDNLLSSKNSNVNTGWLIVTAYYSAFFAAIEMARLHGLLPMSLAAGDIGLLLSKIAGPDELVQEFSNSPPQNFVGEISGNKIIYRSSGAKPHVAAWDQVRKHILKGVVDKTGWIEAVILMYFLSGERSWKHPSDLRNEWNYKRADLFIKNNLGIQFRKLIGNADGGQKWLTQIKHADAENQISILAALAETLCTPITKSLERVRNSGIMERNF
ncbi:hypothetical protein PBOI14_25360 [Pseudomonas sp. Boi14]|nr:hypothetical protein PBOI14_25360 [Pseudomonas sp. Boi14]